MAATRLSGPCARSRAAGLLLLTTLVGCGPTDGVEAKITRSAQARGARDSPDEGLRLAIEQVEQAGGLPLQLAQQRRARDGDAAEELSRLFAGSIHGRLDGLASEQIHRLIKAGHDESLTDFVRSAKPLPDRAAQACDRPRCDFHVDHQYGFFADTSFLDDASLASRLLLLRGADLVFAGDAAPFEADLLRSLHLSSRLSRVERVESRVLAATLRREALDVVEWMFDAKHFKQVEAESLYRVVRDLLADWPPDRRMLIGERAAVIHAYEAIRLGLLDRILTGRERSAMSRRGELEAIETATPERIDHDEARYLELMARLIEQSEMPYSDREDLIGKFSATQQDAPFARLVFLPDLPEALSAVTRDRARCEAWAIALALAIGQERPPFAVCPSNGKEYVVTNDDRGAIVRTGDPIVGDVYVPALPAY